MKFKQRPREEQAEADGTAGKCNVHNKSACVSECDPVDKWFSNWGSYGPLAGLQRASQVLVIKMSLLNKHLFASYGMGPDVWEPLF